ncbi:MAG: hypothetical protein IJX57_07010, partial [Clostridia bacterium]|nr:hypothetical protein [Clostridia bacterium]
MKSRIFKRILALALSMQMVAAIMPQNMITANAEEYMYMHETFADMSAWTNNEGNASLVTADDGNYMQFKLTGSDGEVYRDMPKGVSLADSDIYVVEFDVRFADASSGEVLVYGRGKKLGPTLSYDGSVIKAQTGKVDYVTMRTDAKAGEWYNVKLLANGLKTVYSYTTNLSGEPTTEASKSSVARNMTVAPFGRISLKGNSKTGAVDIRDIKVFKPSPDELHIGVDGAVEKVSLPAEGTTRTINYLVDSTSYNGVDFAQYKPLANGLVHFCLYDSTDCVDLTDNMPEGITLNASTGVLTVSDTAQTGAYTVRLCNYDETAYDSKAISIVEAGAVQTLKLDGNVSEIPVPNNGTKTTAFNAQGYDETNSEVYNMQLKWSLLDSDGNNLEDAGITIDENTGVIS